MGYWKKVTVIKKRINGRVSHGQNIDLRSLYGGISWRNERIFMSQDLFIVGANTQEVGGICYHGLAMSVANPQGNNVFNTQIGIARTRDRNINNGLVRWSGNQYNSNVTSVLYSGLFYVFFFMLAFNNKYNGLVRDSGFEVWAAGNRIAQHYITGNDGNHLNNFTVGYFAGDGGWNGNIEIRPIGNRNFKVGYENYFIHNFFCYTQPVYFQPFASSFLAVEGDM